MGLSHFCASHKQRQGQSSLWTVFSKTSVQQTALEDRDGISAVEAGLLTVQCEREGPPAEHRAGRLACTPLQIMRVP